MTYEQILQRTPPSTAAGNTALAAEFLAFLTTVIEGDRESFTQLTDSQQRYLYKLRTKWQARSSGKDDRWNQVGSRPGRLATDKPRKPRARRADPGEKDPLFISLMRKYGTPKTDE